MCTTDHPAMHILPCRWLYCIIKVFLKVESTDLLDLRCTTVSAFWLYLVCVCLALWYNSISKSQPKSRYSCTQQTSWPLILGLPRPYSIPNNPQHPHTTALPTIVASTTATLAAYLVETDFKLGSVLPLQALDATGGPYVAGRDVVRDYHTTARA